MNGPPLSLWTVYDRPRDYPQGFIARRWEIAGGEPRPTQDAVTGATLDDVRAQLPIGLHPLPRFADDDPCIVECWI